MVFIMIINILISSFANAVETNANIQYFSTNNHIEILWIITRSWPLVVREMFTSTSHKQ